MEKELILNVGRQIGSGGHIIAKMLAEEFDCQYYDREILTLQLRKVGFQRSSLSKTMSKKDL